MNMATQPDAFVRPDHARDVECDFAVHKTLLESTKAIPWKIDWASMSFAYIGPQIEELLGWERGSWLTVEDWSSRIHPEDRERVVNFCVSQSIAGVDHEADYRALTKDNGFVWIRDVVHVVRKPDGEVDCLIGFMFDITDRKKTEQKLLEMQRKLEAFSFEDGLTGAANRRRLDAQLEAEWEAAGRSGQPLSMILLDLDHFKQFNDAYGHLDGDDCLVKVAGALKDVGRRRRDVVARYGGEEFALLLPETDADAAQGMAARIQRLIAELGIPHSGSEVADIVTASIGVATVHPAGGGDARSLYREVDKLLYAAKQGGRNQVIARKL